MRDPQAYTSPGFKLGNLVGLPISFFFHLMIGCVELVGWRRGFRFEVAGLDEVHRR
jgi:hypothetical protein